MTAARHTPVSYTHLDVYKRQVAKSLERLCQVALGYGALLEDVQRHVPLVDPHDNDRHGAVTSFLSNPSLGTLQPGLAAPTGLIDRARPHGGAATGQDAGTHPHKGIAGLARSDGRASRLHVRIPRGVVEKGDLAQLVAWLQLRHRLASPQTTARPSSLTKKRSPSSPWRMMAAPWAGVRYRFARPA